jgi:DNA-binding MarR family transcriptional regulator
MRHPSLRCEWIAASLQHFQPVFVRNVKYRTRTVNSLTATADSQMGWTNRCIYFTISTTFAQSGGATTAEFIVLEDGMLTEKSVHQATQRLVHHAGLDPLTHEAHTLLVKTYTTLTAAARRNNPSSLSLGRYNVLRLLYAAENHRSLMSEIGDALEVSPAVVTRLVDSHVAEGLVERVDHPDDKRKTWAVLTPSGKALFEAEMPLMLLEIEKLWSGMQAREKRLLIHLLSRLRLNLLTSGATE